MTAPRETGAEGRIEELEQMVFAMMATDSLGNVIPADVPEANRRLTAYRDALLATPRPVEVTNGTWWALKRLNEEAECARSKDQAYIGDSTVLTTDVEAVCAALTAALRAQPAGGMFPAVRDLGTIEFNDGMDDAAPVADAGGTPEERHRAGKCGCDEDNGAWCGYALSPAPVADAGGTPERRCKECGGSEMATPLLPRAALNADGVCDYCTAPTLPPVGERGLYGKYRVERTDAPSGEREVDIGLHTRAEIRYHVDHYEARVIHENEAVLSSATGATPSEALARLAAAPHPDGQGVG